MMAVSSMDSDGWTMTVVPMVSVRGIVSPDQVGRRARRCHSRYRDSGIDHLNRSTIGIVSRRTTRHEGDDTEKNQ